MAKARKVVETSATPVEDVEIIETGEEINEALERLYADADVQPSAATAHVYFLEPDGEEAKIWKGEAEQYDLDALARKHGSGKYRLKVYVSTERGNFGIKINRVFTYRLSAEEDARLRAIRSGEVVPNNSGVPQQSLTVEMIVAAVRAAMPAAPVQNNLGMMKEIADIVRTLAPVPVQAVAAPQINPIDMMRLFVDLRRDDGDNEAPRGKSTSTDVFMKLIDKFAPAFVAASMTPGAAQLPAMAGNETPGAAQAVPAAPEEDALLKLRMGISYLVAQAKKQADPQTYADVVLDTVPEDELRVLMQLPDPIAFLSQHNTEVAAYRPWFTELMKEVKAELDAPEDEAADVDVGNQKP